MEGQSETLRTNLVTIHSTDGTPLDGAHYTRVGDARPISRRTVVNYVHGRSMTFYVGMQRFTAAALVAAGYDVAAFNRRGAGVASIRDSFVGVGDAWTTWDQHQMDVRAAVVWARERGYESIAMAVHSLGALLAADYTASDAHMAALILASPVTTFDGLPTAVTDPLRSEVARIAAERVASDRGEELLLLPQWPWIITAQIVGPPREPVTPLDRLLSTSRCPVLLFCGDTGHDARLLPGAQEAFRSASSAGSRMEVLASCDHFYVGLEDAVTALVVAWLTKTVPLDG